MFAQIQVYKNLILGGIILAAIAGLYFYISGLKSDIKDLKITMLETQNKLVNEKRQSSLYRTTLKNQSKQIELLKVNTKLAKTKLQKWKAQPPQVRYKVIYKNREVKSNDCKDIKSTIDSIRSIDYSSL
jgi:hypothetical protein